MSLPIIFDFDGVIVDSEIIANRALAECLTELGFPTTAGEAMARYTGMRMRDCVIAIERRHDCKLPPNFDELCSAQFHSMRHDLQAVPGAVAFVRTRHAERTAIASSSRKREIERSLETVGLADHFVGRIFSAAELERGKPHPDIFLQAAKGIAAHPGDCTVIEDSPLGVQAAVAAGMTVIGLTAASHCGPDHGERLTAAGAHVIARTYEDVAAHMACFGELQPRSRNAM